MGSLQGTIWLTVCCVGLAWIWLGYEGDYERDCERERERDHDRGLIDDNNDTLSTHSIYSVPCDLKHPPSRPEPDTDPDNKPKDFQPRLPDPPHHDPSAHRLSLP